MFGHRGADACHATVRGEPAPRLEGGSGTTMGRIWGIVLLTLGACSAPLAGVAPVQTEVVSLTRNQLDQVVSLGNDVEDVAELERELVRTRTPYTGWMTDGVMVMIASDLDRRRRNLHAGTRSQLVLVSLSTDVDPTLDRLLLDLVDE